MDQNINMLPGVAAGVIPLARWSLVYVTMNNWLFTIPKTKVVVLSFRSPYFLKPWFTLTLIINLVGCYSVLCGVPSPSEFWREVLPRTLKACFGPRFFSVKLQLLETLPGLASAPSPAPGDWGFPLAMGALEGLGNTLSFRLAFRLQRASNEKGPLTNLIVFCFFVTDSFN